MVYRSCFTRYDRILHTLFDKNEEDPGENFYFRIFDPLDRNYQVNTGFSTRIRFREHSLSGHHYDILITAASYSQC